MPPKVRKQFLKPAASRVNAAHRGAPPVVAEINALLQNWKQRLGLWPKPKAGQVFSLASDCSGYGSELLALRLLGLQKKAQLIMTCESCSKKRALHDVMVKICGFDPIVERISKISSGEITHRHLAQICTSPGTPVRAFRGWGRGQVQRMYGVW